MDMLNDNSLFNFEVETDSAGTDNSSKFIADIRIFGVGGGGGNAVKRMYENKLQGVKFIVANTDKQILDTFENLDIQKIQIGAKETKGLGAGANPERGRKAAMEDRDRIADYVKGSNMVFVTAGMGGGTGTGAAPVIASVAKELGILTVGVVTTPFFYEGKKKMNAALEGIRNLSKNVDSIIVIPNDNIKKISDQSTTLTQAFRLVDNVLYKSIQGITDLIVKEGYINRDFADVKTTLSNKGEVLMGIGYGKGEEKEIIAAKSAIENVLVDRKLTGARSVLVNITSNSKLKLHEVNRAMALIREEAHEDATIIFGTYLDDSIEDDGIIIYVIATEFEDSPYNIQYQEELQKPAAVVEPEPKAAGSGIFKTPAKEFENRFNIPINATVNRAQPAYANSSNASYAYNRNIGIPGMVK